MKAFGICWSFVRVWMAVMTVTSGAEPAPPWAENQVRKIFLEPRLIPGNTGIRPLQPIDTAAWVWHPDFGLPGAPGEPMGAGLSRNLHRDFAENRDGGFREPVFLAFSAEFDTRERPLIIHVSADERFELYLDGKRIARGPDRSDVVHWAYATYAIDLSPGLHRLKALCWHLGPLAPLAQLSHRGGFILKAEPPYDAVLTTGKAAWTVERLSGFDLATPSEGEIFGAGGELTAFGCGPAWKSGKPVPAVIVRGPVRDNPWGVVAAGWRLHPSTLPDMIDREIAAGRAVGAGNAFPTPTTVISETDLIAASLAEWGSLLAGRGEVRIPAKAERFFLWDLEDYYCGYPFLEASGGSGATIRWGWAEALYLPGSPVKRGRDEVKGKTFRGFFDTFLPDGGARRPFSTHWWRAGRYCLLAVRTADDPLVLHRLAVVESRYPLENEGRFDGGDPELDGVVRLAARGIQMCSHETFLDCPYYEQLMYVGDARLEMLTTFAMTADARLARRGIELFDFSRGHEGFVKERYPSSVPQHSPTYSLLWAAMLRDFAWWRDDPAFIRARLSGLRAMLDAFEPYLGADSLLTDLPGWSFVDWVPGWDTGIPPDGSGGESSLVNLIYLLAVDSAADLEREFGDRQMASRWAEKAGRIRQALRAAFWDGRRGLIADNRARTEFSEHGQCLALLTDTLIADEAHRAFEGLLSDPRLRRASIYFRFYLLEAWQKFGRGDLIIESLAFWKDLVREGLKTPVESPGEARSDCHGWGSHPLFHLQASLAGVRPSSPGFRTTRVAPQPGRLKKISSRVPHPRGWIILELDFQDGRCRGQVELPAGISGSFVWKGKELPLRPGRQDIALLPSP